MPELLTETDVPNQFDAPYTPGDMSTRTAPYSPEEPLVPPVPMTDAEAERELERYPYGNAQQQEEAKKKFETYWQAKDQKQRLDSQADLQHKLTDPEAEKEFYRQPEVQAAIQQHINPNVLFKQAVVTQYLEDKLQRRLGDGEYEGARNKLIGLEITGQPKIDDVGAFAALQKDAQFRVEEQQFSTAARSELLKGHFESLVANKPFMIGEAFDKVRSSHGELLKDPDHQRQAYEFVAGQDEEMKQLFDRNAPQLWVIGDYVKKFVGQQATDADFVNLQKAFAAIDPHDVGKARAYMVEFGKSLSEEDPTISKNLYRMGSNAAGVPAIWNETVYANKLAEIDNKMTWVDTAMARVMPDGTFFYGPAGPPGSKKPTAEQIVEEKQRLTDEKTKADVVNTLQVDERRIRQPAPIFSKDTHPVLNWFERGIYSTNEQLAPLALGFATFSNPLYGHLAYTYVIGNKYMSEMLADNPGMSYKVARTASYAAAAVESLVEQVEWRALKSPKFLKPLAKMIRTNKPATFIVAWGGVQIWENIEEGIQDASTALIQKTIQEAAKSMDPSLNVGKIDTLDEIWKDWKDQRADVAASVFWLGLAGAGFATHHHVKNAERDIFNEKILAAHGMTPEKIDELMSETDPARRWELYQAHIATRTPEERAQGVIAAQKLADEAMNAAAPSEEIPRATLDTEILPDGSRVYHVLDENGNKVRENLDAQTALDEQANYNQMLYTKQLAEHAQQLQSEDEVARNAEAEAKWELLEPKDKVSTRNVLDFDYAEPSTPEQTKALSVINAMVAERNARLGAKDDIALVAPREPSTRAGLGAVNFVDWFERTFGKRVQFVASKTGQPLSFVGLVDPANPDTIFLDAAGDRNVLSVLGHEWSHTLEHTNPTLHRAMVDQLKPLVVDWAKQTGKLPDTYDADQATPEFVANVVGDAFGDPDFWATVRAQNPSLFERILAAIKEWFDAVVQHTSEWGTQSPDVVKDVQAVRDLIAKTLQQAKEQGAETVAEEETYAEGPHGEVISAAREGQAAVPRSYAPMKKGDEPKKTRVAYKLFDLRKDGSLRPLFIDKTTAVPVGTWLAAKHVPTPGFKERPGWHAGQLPLAPHLRTKEDLRAENRVWAEVLMGNDVDWQTRADASPTKDIPDRVPKGGSYQHTVSRLQGGGWIIGGELKVSRVLSNEDVANILTASGNADQVEAETRSMGQAAEPRSAHKFGAVRGARQVDEQGGYIEPDDEILIDRDLNKWLDDEKIPAGERRNALFQKARKQVHEDIMSTRAHFPDKPSKKVTDPWDHMPVTGASAEFKPAKEGEEPTIKATGKWQGQPYRFDQIPEGMSREQWSAELSRRVVAQFKDRLQKGFRPDATASQRAGALLIVKELEWYREFTFKLRQEFGGAADFMADLMGAFSPRQNVELNWRNAIDMIWGISSGKYDDLLSELDAYLRANPEHTMKTWRDVEHKPVIKARSGALFGTNTDLGHYAAVGLWRAIQAGDAPKAKNFTRNIIALSYRATIDVWAARLLDRVAGKPRIPLDAEGAVQGSHMTDAQLKKAFGDDIPLDIPIVGQFAFGQEVFEQVAAAMRDPATWENTGLPEDVIAAFANVTAADVQATNWFVEKEIWTENDWTNEAGAGGSFIHEIENMVGGRFQVGISQARPGFLPQDSDQASYIAAVQAELNAALPEAISLRVKDTLGVYKDNPPERSLDLEMTHPPGMEPNDLLRIALKWAQAKDQEATHLTRVKDKWESMENSRPGIEVMFSAPVDLARIQEVTKEFTGRGINGFTMVVDQRAKLGSGEYIGVRFQYVPEYSGDGKKWTKNAKKIRDLLADASRNILQMEGVASASLHEYDTVVFEKGKHYDSDGVFTGAIGSSEAQAWRSRYFDAVARKAVERNARDIAAEALDVLHRQQIEQQQEAGPPGGVGPPVPVTIFDAGLMQFTQREMPASNDLRKQLSAEASALGEILKCLQL